MGTEIIKSFGNLQNELEKARSFLKGVDENIKRLIGRDPSDIVAPPAPNISRGFINDEPDRTRPFSQVVSRNRSFGPENNDPSTKKRSVFKRLSDKPIEEEIWIHPPKQLISKVIVTPREVPSRQEVLASRRTDEKSKARNKRMFGALLGTLQKFQQEETRLKSKEQKRAQVEKKIDDLEIKEKEEVRKERQELFFNRRKKLVEIKILEIKMMRMREFATWEKRIRPRTHFILTKAKPQIQYMPRRLNDTSKALLGTSKVDVEKLIEDRKKDVFAELQRIEERILKNFELRNPKDEHRNHNDNEIKNDDTDDEISDQATKDDFVSEVCEAEIQDILNKVNGADENEEFPVPQECKSSTIIPEEMEVAEDDTNDTTQPEINNVDNSTSDTHVEPDNKGGNIEEQSSTYDDSKSRTEESE